MIRVIRLRLLRSKALRLTLYWLVLIGVYCVLSSLKNRWSSKLLHTAVNPGPNPGPNTGPNPGPPLGTRSLPAGVMARHGRQGGQQTELGRQGGQQTELGWQGGQQTELGRQGGQQTELGRQGGQQTELGRQGGQQTELGRQGGQQTELGRQGGQQTELGRQGGQQTELARQGGQQTELGRQGGQQTELGRQGGQQFKLDVLVNQQTKAVSGDPGGEQVHNVTCPLQPKVQNPNFTVYLNNITHDELVADVGGLVHAGGHFLPDTCRSEERLAIIIPFRDRQRNLMVLLRNLIPFLARQMIEFTVFVVEQTSEELFNKGVLFNAAYRELSRGGNFTCYVMNDVDLIPMDNRNLYRCAHWPRHLCLSTGTTEWKNKLPYPLMIGGAFAMRKEHIEKVNGFSVSYYGWGLEDDDLAMRIARCKMGFARYTIPIGRYYALGHARQKHNTQWVKLKKSIRARMKYDGLNSLNYTMVARDRLPLFTRLLVRVPPPPKDIYDK